MRFFAKFAVALTTLTLALHYFCRVSECSVELQTVCHYTSPAGLNELLLENSEFYRDQIHPVTVLVHEEYAKRVEPSILRLGNDIYENVYVPVVVCFRDKYESLELDKYTSWFSKELAAVRRKLAFYYNVVIRPSIQKLIYRCRLDGVCSSIHGKLGPFLEKLRFIWHYLRPLTERAKSSVSQGYSDLKNKYYQSSHWMDNGSFHETAVISSDSESEEETDEEDEDEEIETSTMTSTIVVTVTMDDQAIASPIDDQLEVSELETLQDEFEAWSNLIEQKSSRIVSLFNKDTEKVSQAEIDKVEEEIKHKTQQLSQLAQSYFRKLTKSIQDINCTSEIDPNSGELIYFDRTGTTQLATYVTRPLVRAVFKETHEELEKLTQDIEQDLRSLTDRLEARVKDIRDDVLELYEEWGDVMISEWSKRLAYVDVVSSHFDGAESEEQEDISSENWKKFLKLKKQVIKARDDLAEAPAELRIFKQFLNKAQLVVETITKESGEYLYILRARANLAFQERERQEREKSMAPLESERHHLRSANETISQDEPNHVEDSVHKPVEESTPVTEQS